MPIKLKLPLKSSDGCEARFASRAAERMLKLFNEKQSITEYLCLSLHTHVGQFLLLRLRLSQNIHWALLKNSLSLIQKVYQTEINRVAEIILDSIFLTISIEIVYAR